MKTRVYGRQAARGIIMALVLFFLSEQPGQMISLPISL